MMENAILLPARDISSDATLTLEDPLRYLKRNEVLFVEEGDEVEKEAQPFLVCRDIMRMPF